MGIVRNLDDAAVMRRKLLGKNVSTWFCFLRVQNTFESNLLSISHQLLLEESVFSDPAIIWEQLGPAIGRHVEETRLSKFIVKKKKTCRCKAQSICMAANFTETCNFAER